MSVGTKGLHLGVGGGRKPRVTGGIGPFRYYQSIGAASPHPAGRVASSSGSCIGTLAKGAVLLVGCVLAWSLVKGIFIQPPGPPSDGQRTRNPGAFDTMQATPVPTEPPSAPAGAVTVPPTVPRATATPAAKEPAASVSEANHPDFSLAEQVFASRQLAAEKYPDLDKPGTPLHRLFVLEHDRQAKAASLRLTNGNWPMWLADECQARLRNPKLPPIAIDPPKSKAHSTNR